MKINHGKNSRALLYKSVAVVAMYPILSMDIVAAEQNEPLLSLEEVVVTARRTQESLQSIPVSVTAIGEADLRRKGISNLEDIQLATPGVHLSGAGGRSNPVYQIRGQSKALSGAMSPAVVTYFGEVPEPNYGSFVPQYDLSSIQVLKGPQGTLFGRNTTGGAILYTPQAPTFETTGYVSTTLGNYDLRKFEGAVNLPVIEDKLAVRLVGTKTKRDGYTDDIRTGDTQDNDNTEAFRLSVLFTPTEHISNTFIIDQMKRDTNGDSIVAIDYVPGGYLPNLLGIDASLQAAIASLDAREVETTRDTSESIEKTFINNRTEIDFGSFQVINIFGYRDVDLRYLANSDGLPVLITDGTGPSIPFSGVPIEFIKAALHQELEQYTNELQFKGQALDEKLDWLLGAYWLKSKPTGPQGTWTAFAAPAGTAGRPTAYNFQTEESKAVFGHGSYQLDSIAEGLAFELGVRYTKDTIEACTGTGTDSTTTVELSECENADTSKIVGSSVNKASSNETTWSIGLNWQVTDDTFTYAVSRHGYRAGGINSPTFSGRLEKFQSFEPETVTDYEVGLRSDWEIGDVAVRTNISAFLGKYTDVQAPVSGVNTQTGVCEQFLIDNPGAEVPAPISPDGTCTSGDDPSGNTLMINMGEAETSGIDAEITIVPVENLTLSVSGSYIDTKTKKIVKPDDVAAYMTTIDEVRFEYVAQKSMTASINYSLPIDSDALENINFHADYYWTDDISFAGAWMIPSYSVTNVRVDFEGVVNQGMEVGLFVRNLFDKEYVSAGAVAGPTYGMNAGIYAPPRMYGAELRFNF